MGVEANVKALISSLDRGRKIIWPWWCWGTFRLLCVWKCRDNPSQQASFAYLADLTYILDSFFSFPFLFSSLFFPFLFPYLCYFSFHLFIFLCWSLLPFLSRWCLIFLRFMLIIIFLFIFSFTSSLDILWFLILAGFGSTISLPSSFLAYAVPSIVVFIVWNMYL